MLEKLSTFWNTYGLEILVGLSLLAIVILALFRIGKKGTWTDRLNFSLSPVERKGRRPPQESKGEIECRRVLEEIFGRPFGKTRPDFLRNPITSEQGDINLELDCYNNELKLACEYNGSQHYKYIPFFHKNREAFQNQKYRDYLKRDLCGKNGVRLIEVPYTVKNGEIRGYIISELRKMGFRV